MEVSRPQEPVSIEFWADDDYVERPGCTMLHWLVSGVREVYLGSYESGEEFPTNYEGVVGNGDSKACPEYTTTYVLRVILRDGSETYETWEVEVEEPSYISGLNLHPVAVGSADGIVLGLTALALLSFTVGGLGFEQLVRQVRKRDDDHRT